MSPNRFPPSRRSAPLLAVMLGLAIAGAPRGATAQTQYRVVQPDGSVTFTDRPPPPAPGVTVTPLGRGAVAAPAEPLLPTALRQTMQRHPVTLYTAADCRTCDVARRYLQQRGVPYAERIINPDAEAVAALERLVGARTVPALTIGTQPLRGFAEADWAAYLDAAGYPRESSLPRGWAPPAPTPLVPQAPARTSAPSAVVTPAAAPAEAAGATPPPAPTGSRP